MENGRPRRRSRSRSPRGQRDPRDSDRQRSPPRGPRNRNKDEKYDRRDRYSNNDRSARSDRCNGRSRSRSPPRGPRDRGPTDIRQRSPRPARGARRDSDEDKYKRPGSERERRDTKYVNGVNGKDHHDKSRPPVKKEERVDIMDIDPMHDEDDMFRASMRQTMGFGMFRTTKDTKVPGNDKLYAVRKEKKTQYRQYMNRQGGFNRPLSPTRGA